MAHPYLWHTFGVPRTLHTERHVHGTHILPSERPWATQRPRSGGVRAPWTWRVAPFARRHQQARDTMP